MAKRFYSTYKSTKSVTYNVEIWDTAFAGTATSFDIGEGGFQLRMSGEGDQILNHISPTDCEFDYMLANATDFALVTDLSVAAEGRFTIKISKGAISPTPFWYGQIVPDVGSYSEENYPQKFTIRATDGIGLLKTIDFKDTSAAYAGKERALFMIKNALKKLPYVSIHYGSGDNFIATVLDTWEETMDNGGTDPCALFQTYLDYSVWQTYDKGEEKYTSCYDVIKNILTPLGARLTTRNGLFWIEQIFYRPETTVIVRTYTRDGGLASADNYATINDINQTAGGALLAVGEYEFFPALRRVEHLYEINLRRNFLESVSPLDETVSSQTVYKPIDGSTDSTTLRLSGKFTYSIRSNIFDGTGNTPLDPFCIILRIDLTLDTQGLVRLYNLTTGYQVVYDPIEWDVIPGFYVAIPITNTGFLSNLTDYIFSGTQALDIFTPLIPETCENFNINIDFVTFKKFNGGTYLPVDFDLTFELNNPWLEAYSYGDPAITEDEQLYGANNPDTTNNSELYETSSIVGTSTDPNALGAFWVKPAATYQLAHYWAIGPGTADRQVEWIMVGAILAQQKTPVRRIQGTFYGSIDILARYLWDGVYWLVLGGSWDADNDQFTGTLVELREYEAATFSPPIKRKKFLVSNTLPTVAIGTGQGGPVYDLIAKPPATVIYSVALTTSDEALLSGAITSLPISETMVANDVLDGDTVVIVNPLTGDFDELTVTATAVGGETAIAVSGTLTVNYPANAPIVRRPRLGRFFLPEGTTGDILYYDGTAWVVLHIGTAGQVLTVSAGLPAWTTGGGGYTDEQAQDAVGGILTDTTEIDFTYNDVTPSITADIKTNSLLFAKIQQIATARFLGRVTAGTGDIEALTAAQMQTALGYPTGSGTTNKVAKFTASTVIGDSIITDTGTNVAVNNGTPLARFHVSAGDIGAYKNTTGSPGASLFLGDTNYENASFFDKAPGLTALYNAVQGVASDLGFYSYNGSRNLRAIIDYQGFFGIGTATPARLLHVAGSARITGSTGTATTITGRDANGDISNVSVGTGLSLSGGTLSATATGNITGTMTATRVQFAASASALDDDANLTWDDTNKRLLIGTGATQAFLNVFSGAITGATEFLRMSGNINGNMIAYLLNANNASTGANAFFGISAGGSGAGDAFMQFIISGANTWAWGIDNSDGDAMKLSLASTPGSSVATDYIIAGTDGRISLGGTALLVAINLTVNGVGGIRVPSGTSAQRPAVTNTIIRNNTTFGGLEFKNPFGQWARLTGSNPTGTITPGPGAGTSPTITAVGTDRAFKLTITTGSAPTLNGEILSINYGTSFDILPYIALTAYNQVSATDYNKFYIDFNAVSGFSIKANGTLTALTTYVLSVVVQQ